MILKRTLSRWFATAPKLLHSKFAPSNELHTVLFHSTFRIQGANKNDPNQTSFGTALIMGVPKERAEAVSFAVLITAAHVLEDIGGDTASLLVRHVNADGNYTAYPYNIQIRDGGRTLYVKHPDADIAAMYVSLPADVPITGLAPDFLADDQRLRDIELHPGDEIFCLGFPLAAAAPGASNSPHGAHGILSTDPNDESGADQAGRVFASRQQRRPGLLLLREPNL
jgi:hypothetical protein